MMDPKANKQSQVKRIICKKNTEFNTNNAFDAADLLHNPHTDTLSSSTSVGIRYFSTLFVQSHVNKIIYSDLLCLLGHT